MISLSAGDVVAGYHLDELAGRGGMGVVFRATHIALDRQVAVKLIAPELAADEQFRQRFQRESRVAASIDHPHVIPIFDAGDADGQLYVAMRYVEGTDLGELVAREGNLAPSQAVDLIAQVSDALEAAHERGLVHRDVKPANVLLERRGADFHAYLTDFGLVKTVGAASGVLTRTGQWLGTPDYTAPEQILTGEVDARTDVYALGCMLYQTLAGKPPFQGETDMAKMFAHLSQPAPSLLDARPETPASLDEVIQTALAKEPAERYASANELALAARGAIGTPPPMVETKVVEAEPTATPDERETVAQVPPSPPSSPPPAPPPPTPAAPHAETRLAPTPPARSSPPGDEVKRSSAQPRRRWLVAAAAVALLGGGALALVVSGGDDEDPTGAIPEANLTSNPSFERDTSEWDVFESEIVREKAADAPEGENVARVTLVGSPGEYSIDDSPETVTYSRKGRFYTASAWVKATEATDGERICISLREGLEDGDEDFPFSDSSVRASASEYREVRVTHRASAEDLSIGVHVYPEGSDVDEGEAFLVDAITLTQEARGQASGQQAECEA